MRFRTTWLLVLGFAIGIAHAALLLPAGGRTSGAVDPPPSGDWADVFATSSGMGAALVTDEQIVGLRGVNTTEYGTFIGPNPNGGSVAIVEDCSFDGEDCIHLIPPDSCQTLADCPDPQDDNAGYTSILTGVDITNGGTHAISQLNIRFLFYMGSRYIDLAGRDGLGPKWICMLAVTAPGTSSPSNRACLFESYVSTFSGRVIAVTVDEVQNYHEPLIAECTSFDCGTAAQKIQITRASPDHSASPQITGAGEWICIELEWDVSQTNGNANGRNKVYIDTRDGVISKESSVPLTYDAGWNFALDSIAVIEGIGWYFNVDSEAANADNYIDYSHVALSANREPDERIGCPPGFFE